MPSEKNRTAQMYANREEILEEACDQIHTIFSKLHQFGYSEDDIAAGIHRSNEKARERGLID
jgi:phosphoribosyl-ATP pyrophosphohydrolase